MNLHGITKEKGTMKNETKNQRLIGALFLAITAPTEAKSRECVTIAESLAEGMSEKTIERCKALAALAAKSATDRARAV